MGVTFIWCPPRSMPLYTCPKPTSSLSFTFVFAGGRPNSNFLFLRIAFLFPPVALRLCHLSLEIPDGRSSELSREHNQHTKIATVSTNKRDHATNVIVNAETKPIGEDLASSHLPILPHGAKRNKIVAHAQIACIYYKEASLRLAPVRASLTRDLSGAEIVF